MAEEGGAVATAGKGMAVVCDEALDDVLAMAAGRMLVFVREKEGACATPPMLNSLLAIWHTLHAR